jgi:hypothetical protein
VAICSFAEQRLLPENRTQPISEGQRLVIYHSIVGSAESAYGYFLRSTNLESHFIVRKNGGVMQLIDTARTADANYRANGFAISVETEDNGRPDSDPWTAAQLYSLARLGIWARQHHPKIKAQRADHTRGSGYGYHTMFGAPSDWTPVAKSCPGIIRIKQFNDVLLPSLLKDPVIPMATTNLPGDPKIIWYSKRNAVTRKVTNHAYIVRSSGFAKWLDPESLKLSRQIGLPENTAVFGPEWQRTVLIADGPCKNV